jgi:hypothetical protein
MIQKVKSRLNRKVQVSNHNQQRSENAQIGSRGCQALKKRIEHSMTDVQKGRRKAFAN